MHPAHLAHLIHGGMKLIELGWGAWQRHRDAAAPGTVYAHRSDAGVVWYAVPPGGVRDFLQGRSKTCRPDDLIARLEEPGCRDAAHLVPQLRREHREVCSRYPGMAVFVSTY